jgi:transposase
MERLHMNYLRDVIHRLRAGDSQRRIAQELKISRSTVSKYRDWAAAQGYLQPECTLPDAATLAAALGDPPRLPRQESSVEPHREVVQRLLDQGVEMTAIWQRLQKNYGYRGSYSSVRRFVNHLCPAEPDAVVRVHTAPGEEAQVDFGRAGQLYDPASGQVRTAYVFVATLCYSRHQYAELVFDQKTPTWLALHRRAFDDWGGVPQRMVPDNLKAAVLKAMVYDPVLGEAYRRMAQHYGFVVSPTTPGVARHKGKVESGVKYVKRNFMAGQEFVDIHVANQHLKSWVREVAGTRDHGTTHQPPLRLFHEYEKAALLPLPEEPFTLCEIKLLTVHPDCHVSFDGSYYSVPYTYLGHQLEVHIHEQIVAIYQGQKLVATHVRCQKRGQWRTRLEDYPPYKAEYLKRTPEYCRQQATRLGPATSQVIDTLLADRPLYRLRAVQAILSLEETVGPHRLEAACARALYFGDIRYRRIKDILNAALDCEPLPEAVPSLPEPPHVFARSGAEFFAPAQPVLPLDWPSACPGQSRGQAALGPPRPGPDGTGQAPMTSGPGEMQP